MEPLKYKPISKPDTIRLLILAPANNYLEPIQGYLVEAPIGDGTPYEALSYTWGPPEPHFEICVDGQILTVGRNLLFALVYLRRRPLIADSTPDQWGTAEWRLLWIDAICIDQSNVHERSEQVSLMHHVYFEADKVVVWLGEEGDESAVALQLLETLEEQWSQNIIGMSSAVVESVKQSVNENTWRALSMLLSRPWFERVWILQEVAMARHIEVHCGPHSVKWSTLTTALKWITNYRLSELLSTVTAKVTTLETLNVETRSGDPRSLLKLLRMARFCQATDPRDKVYALLGMVKGSGELGMKIDYTLTTQDVYRDVVKFIIKQRQDLDVLSLIGYGRNMVDLQSWVPDLTFRRQSHELGFLLRRSCQLDVSKYKAEFQEFSDPSCLILQGVVLDSIELVCSTASLKPIFKENEDSAVVLSELETFCDGFLSSEMAIFSDLTAEEAMLDQERVQFTNEIPEEFMVYYMLWQVHFGTEPLHYRESAESKLKLSKLSESSPSNEWIPNWTEQFGSKGLHVSGFKSTSQLPESAPPVSGEHKEEEYEYEENPRSNRIIFKTQSGRFGMGLSDTKAGDIVAILCGGRLPFVLRPRGEEFALVGKCFVYDVNLNEAMVEGSERMRSFTLV